MADCESDSKNSAGIELIAHVRELETALAAAQAEIARRTPGPAEPWWDVLERAQTAEAELATVRAENAKLSAMVGGSVKAALDTEPRFEDD